MHKEKMERKAIYKMGQSEQRIRHKKRKRRHNGTPCWLLIAMLVIDLCLICVAGRCLYHFFHMSDLTWAAGIEALKNVSEQNEGSGINWKEDHAIPVKEEKDMTLDSEFMAECRRLYAENQDLLVLVNKECALPDTYELPLQSLQNKRVKVAAVMYEDLREMLKDASDYGYTYSLVSGFRDAEYQQGLVQKDVQKYMRQENLSLEEALEKTYEQVMPSGHSEHETGLAIDITASGNTALDETQAEEPGIIWLHENCRKYGFILRYPQDKEDITQISYEPWHFRYVGREAAEFLYEQELTLEEFYEYLE